MSNELSAARYRRALRDHTDRLAECVGVAGREASVPTCPDWTVADLVEHVGQSVHWISDIVQRRITDPAQLPTEMAVLPADAGAWPAWLSEAAARAAAACSDAALEAPVFNASGDHRTGGWFWLQSLVNEAVIHGVDAAAAAGQDLDIAADVAPDVAAGLVTNHLMMLTSPTWAAQVPESAEALRGAGETLHWHATDEPGLGEAGEWFVERHPDGASWQHRHGGADVTVHGPARSLLLVLTRRLPLTNGSTDHVSVDGDADLARHWLQHTAHVAD